MRTFDFLFEHQAVFNISVKGVWFKDKATITEYYLPKDCPNFCNGCISCTIKGENSCKDAEYIGRIDNSLLKAFLDHFAYRWLPHRPASEMFGKPAH